jgi:hypothetical protein
MAAHDTTNALNHPHPDFPFSAIGDDKITAFTTLVAIFKNKFKKPLAPVIIDSPIKAIENKRAGVLIRPVITPPAKHNYQKRSQTEKNEAPSHVSDVNPSGKTGTQIPQLPLGDNSSPWGDNAVCT